MTDRVNDSTTLRELEVILIGLEASMAVDLTGHQVLVTLTCADAASAASSTTMPAAIDRAIGRLLEARELNAPPLRGAFPRPRAAPPIELTSHNLVHPTDVRCSLCGAFESQELESGDDYHVRPAFTAVRAERSVQLCNTLIAGPMRVVDGREYHEVRVLAAVAAAATKVANGG